MHDVQIGLINKMVWKVYKKTQISGLSMLVSSPPPEILRVSLYGAHSLYPCIYVHIYIYLSTINLSIIYLCLSLYVSILISISVSVPISRSICTYLEISVSPGDFGDELDIVTSDL